LVRCISKAITGDFEGFEGDFVRSMANISRPINTCRQFAIVVKRGCCSPNRAMKVACEDAAINATLQQLLSQPDPARRAAVHELALRLKCGGAQEDLIEAIACLIDDDIAEQAYVRIFKCAREIRA
jgi:hypothetical protein